MDARLSSAMPSDQPRKGLLRRAAIVAAAAAGAVVVLVAGLLLLLSSSAVARRVTDVILPRASAALGREVTLRSTELRLFPSVRVRLSGFAVAGRPGEPALIEADGLAVELALWPLVRSLGKEIAIEAVALERPTVNLVRGRDGVWSYEGLGAAPREPSAPGQARPPAAPRETPGTRTAVSIRRISIRDGAVRVIDHGGGRDETSVALEQIGFDASGLGAGLPADVHLSAALAAEKPNLELRVSVAALPQAVPARAEDWPAVQGSLSFGPLPLDRLGPLLPSGFSALVRGGVAALTARLATSNGAYRIEGAGELRDLRLRGQPASGRFRAAATISPARLAASRLELSDLEIKGPGVDIGGNAAVETAPLRARFAVNGPLLDLDAVMGLVPEKTAEQGPAPKDGPLLPPGLRRQVQSAEANGTLDVAELRSGKLRATGVHARVVLAGGVLEVRDLTAGLYGGRFVASGTRVDLGAPEPGWTLRARLQQVDVASAMQSVLGRAPLAGRADASLSLDGTGIEWSKLRDRLNGAADVALENGALSGADLGGEVLGALGKGLSAAGRQSAAKRIAGAGGRTELRDLSARFRVKDGWMQVEKPLRFATPAGPVELGGRIGLDLRLDLRGTVAVPRAALASVAPAAVRLPESLAVPVAFGGTLEAPSISVRADEVVAQLARGQAREAAKALQEESARRGRKAIGDVLRQLGGK